MLTLIAREVDGIRDLSSQLEPHVRAGRAPSVSFATDSWDAIVGDLLPGLMNDAQSTEVASKLTAFYWGVRLTNGNLADTVRMRAQRPRSEEVPKGPSTELESIADNMLTTIHEAEHLMPAIQNVITSYNTRIPVLRADA